MVVSIFTFTFSSDLLYLTLCSSDFHLVDAFASRLASGDVFFSFLWKSSPGSLMVFTVCKKITFLWGFPLDLNGGDNVLLILLKNRIEDVNDLSLIDDDQEVLQRLNFGRFRERLSPNI